MKPIDIARAERIRYVCANCGKTAVRVLETKKNREGIRRRRECSACNHRDTTYEVSQELYRELKEAHAVNKKILSLLKLDAFKKVDEKTCDNCAHYKNSLCYFEFPDAGGTFAEECSLFELIETQSG